MSAGVYSAEGNDLYCGGASTETARLGQLPTAVTSVPNSFDRTRFGQERVPVTNGLRTVLRLQHNNQFLFSYLIVILVRTRTNNIKALNILVCLHDFLLLRTHTD